MRAAIVILLAMTPVVANAQSKDPRENQEYAVPMKGADQHLPPKEWKESIIEEAKRYCEANPKDKVCHESNPRDTAKRPHR